MSLSLKTHLRRQTLALVGITFGVCLFVLVLSSIFQGYKSQDATIAGMIGTSSAQVNLLLPSFLLPEEKAGQNLMLKRFQTEENLSAAKILVEEKIPTEWRDSCQLVGEMHLCRRWLPSEVALMVPITDGGRIYGNLLKTKTIDSGLLDKSLIPAAVMVALALLLSLLGLIGMVTRLTTREIPAATETLLDGVRRCLAEENVERLLTFRFEEFRQLSEAIDQLIRSSQDARRTAAVARMTQMLAHDVRKPFSILKMGLGMLGNAKDPAAVKNVLSRLVPEIDKAVSSVDGLIADVMEVGSTSTQLIQEPTRPEMLIEACLDEIFRVYPKSDVHIAYDLRHDHTVNVHCQKVGRVFSNIVGNAVQAMKHKGQIWFKTREVNGWIEFTVGNAGSVIPQENLPKLFEAFFTSGKKGGTGLGLAIAEKVVKAHGGKIWCESTKTAEHPEGYVEFKFTLPLDRASQAKSQPSTSPLPAHSSEITKAILAAADAARPADDAGGIEPAELKLEADLMATGKALGRSLRVLIVDDEDIYRQALAATFARTPELTNALVVRMAADSDQALAMASKAGYDLVITDVDLGLASKNGFELVQALRSMGITSHIGIVSNRIVADDHRTALEAGADAFISKPASRAQLLKLVLQAAQKAKAVAPTRQDIVSAAANGNTVAVAKPEVLVVDDNIFILEAWEQALRGDTVVHLIDNPEALAAKIAQDPAFLTRLSYVITDHNFDGSLHDGLDVGRMVKNQRRDLPVLLSSDAELRGSDLSGSIDAVIAKEPVGYRELRQLLVAFGRKVTTLV